MLATVICSFGPAVVYGIYGTDDLSARLALIAFGIAYFPMALLAVVLFDSLSGLNPILVLVSIMRVSLPYLAVCTALALVVAIQMFAHTFLEPVSAWISYPVIEFLTLYGLMVSMRLLGILYRYHADRLRWF